MSIWVHSNVRVVSFLYISLAEILVFSNDSYFFVNIENIEGSGSLRSASLTFLPGWLSAWNFWQMNLRRMVIFQISTFQRSIFALFGPIREAFGSFKGFLERYSPAEPIAMFHSEWPHWSCWIQNMPLFKVDSFFMYYSCILCRYKGCLSRGCVISLWRTLICLYDFIRTGRPL